MTINKKNEAFAKMTKMEKRIAIAKDVISQVRAKKLKASPGTYCYLNLNRKQKLDKKGRVELQTLMNDGAIASCDVCAIGGIFASKVSIGNNFKVKVSKNWINEKLEIEDESIEDDDMVKSLKGIYTERELRLIEYAFEGKDIYDIFDKKPDNFHDALKNFYKEYKKSENRLIAIMENIIRNEGEFKPEDIQKLS